MCDSWHVFCDPSKGLSASQGESRYLVTFPAKTRSPRGISDVWQGQDLEDRDVESPERVERSSIASRKKGKRNRHADQFAAGEAEVHDALQSSKRFVPS